MPLEPAIYADRRRRLMERMGDRAAAVFFAAPEAVRSNDTHFDYRQSSDLLYLTGFEEPDAALVLLPGHDKHGVVFFVRKRDREREVWDGPRVGPEGAKERYGADEAFPIEELETRLPEMLEGRERVHVALGHHPDRDALVVRAIGRAKTVARKGKRVPREIHDPALLLHEMRLFKTGPELASLRRAVEVSADAHLRAMKATKPGVGEWEIQAEVEYAFRRAGARAPGYTTIAGSGPNACVLHYVENRRRMQDGDLLLLDAGAELDHYTGDITRTWPVSGTFSAAQREVYDLVLAAQRAVIRMVKPGLRYSDMHDTAVRVLTEGLVDRGVIDGPAEKAIEDKTFRAFYMHGTGHWLGMDVHDVGAYHVDEASRPLEAGMVFTVEPGLYFSPDEPRSPARWRGLGVRIEDDVLVTESGCEVLSKGAPVDPDEIERVVGTGV
jgi:Xaa-Pro aminopeptidase